MKKILITGANSYVGISVERYLSRWPEKYSVDTVDMIGEGWREASFRGYDTVLHVAGIVHQRKTKNDPGQEALYHRVNTCLPIETAQKAKAEGVGQFIFMSSASVYGIDAPMGQVVILGKDTPLMPADHYGKSKLAAEEGLLPLAEESFKILILRPPMIYGKGCKGNYQTLRKLAKKLPLFPWVENQRSVLYIENLAEFIRLMVENEESGLYCPQDKEYVNTCEMVNLISHFSGKNILMVRGFGWALRLLRPVTGMVDKAFGSLCYDRALSGYKEDYCVKSLSEAIEAAESGG